MPAKRGWLLIAHINDRTEFRFLRDSSGYVTWPFKDSAALVTASHVTRWNRRVTKSVIVGSLCELAPIRCTRNTTFQASIQPGEAAGAGPSIDASAKRKGTRSLTATDALGRTQ
jgi:hypothetical protein